MSEIPILYEDADYIVINKPAGLVVHADGKTAEPTVADWVLEHAAKSAPKGASKEGVQEEIERMKNVGEPTTLSDGRVIFRPGIVHRIDRETSGVLLIAKNQPAYEWAKKQFQDRLVRKTYHAFVYGEVKARHGKIDRPIARSKNDFRQWTAQRGGRGEEREAVTEYAVLKTGALGEAAGDASNEQFSFVEIHPLTGRTHQIRVHFKAINHPVVCDSLYAPNRECPADLGRLALHASALEFETMKGDAGTPSKKIKVEAPLPAAFDRFASKLS